MGSADPYHHAVDTEERVQNQPFTLRPRFNIHVHELIAHHVVGALLNVAPSQSESKRKEESGRMISGMHAVDMVVPWVVLVRTILILVTSEWPRPGQRVE